MDEDQIAGPIPAPGPRATEPDDNIITIIVCSSCRDAAGSDARPRPGETLAENARLALDGQAIRIEQVECLGNCKRRLSAAILKPGAWSYVFGDLSVENGPDLVAGAALFATSTDGIMPWRGRPDCLKRGLVARIPPLPIAKDAQ